MLPAIPSDPLLFLSLPRRAPRARRNPAAPPALTWAPSDNSPAESWARAAPSRAGEQLANRASAASSGSEAAAPAPLPMPTCGEVSQRGRGCPGPRRRAELASPAPHAPALARRPPRRGAPAGPGAARWGSRLRRDGRSGGSSTGSSRTPELLCCWASGEGGRSRARTSNPRSPALGRGNVGLRPAARRGRSGARQRLLLQAPGPAPPVLGTARYSFSRHGSGRLFSSPSGTAQPGSARPGSSRLSSARLGTALPESRYRRLTETPARNPSAGGNLPPLEEKEAQRSERAELAGWGGRGKGARPGGGGSLALFAGGKSSRPGLDLLVVPAFRNAL